MTDNTYTFVNLVRRIPFPLFPVSIYLIFLNSYTLGFFSVLPCALHLLLESYDLSTFTPIPDFQKKFFQLTHKKCLPCSQIVCGLWLHWKACCSEGHHFAQRRAKFCPCSETQSLLSYILIFDFDFRSQEIALFRIRCCCFFILLKAKSKSALLSWYCCAARTPGDAVMHIGKRFCKLGSALCEEIAHLLARIQSCRERLYQIDKA